MPHHQPLKIRSKRSAANLLSSSTRHTVKLQLRTIQPINYVLYRTAPSATDFRTSINENMLAINLKKPAQTRWALPVIFAPKEEWTLRFCVDYRTHHAVTATDLYSFLKMDKCIESLVDAQVFWTLHTSSSYWRIEFNPYGREKTEINSHRGL